MFAALKPLLFALDPEAAHNLTLAALKTGLVPAAPADDPILATTMAGLALPNPIGLAAGFDKDAEVPDAMLKLGFGFVECGSVCPRPQPGNAKPRLFRLMEDEAVINRFGFNSKGVEFAHARLTARAGRPGIVGINLGANKDSDDRAADFAKVLASCGPHLDFATVNVSSPNTESLRDLQGKAALAALLDGVMAANAALARPIPIFLKIAPDLTDAELADIAAVATSAGLSAIIATNTTLSRDGLKSPHAGEKGGLSGTPLFEKSTRILARLAGLTDLPLVGVGGISSAEDAYAKILAGASAVQLYTALVYGGISLADEITRGLDRLLARDGYANVAEAVGKGRAKWT